MDETVCRFAFLSYLSILEAPHCSLFLESTTRLYSCAVVLYTILPPDLVTVALHYFLKKPGRAAIYTCAACSNQLKYFYFFGGCLAIDWANVFDLISE
jgi:hypothetical protein